MTPLSMMCASTS
uniref:Uncharacterized protein n=1 Tax=Anguilla anguilla TaxID=7936 RepID=A0A0E9U215_ANGAN